MNSLIKYNDGEIELNVSFKQEGNRKVKNVIPLKNQYGRLNG